MRESGEASSGPVGRAASLTGFEHDRKNKGRLVNAIALMKRPDAQRRTWRPTNRSRGSPANLFPVIDPFRCRRRGARGAVAFLEHLP